jgi:hypothetical protein
MLDITDTQDLLPTELSCAERSVSAPQSVTANLMAATAVTSYLYNLLIRGEVTTREVTFSAKQINMRAESKARAAVRRALPVGRQLDEETLNKGKVA